MPAVINPQNLNVADYVPKVKNGTNTTVAEPTDGIVYVAAYSIDQGFRAQMDQWYKDFDPDKIKGEAFEITETHSSDEKLSQSGHKSEEVETSVGWFNMIRRLVEIPFDIEKWHHQDHWRNHGQENLHHHAQHSVVRLTQLYPSLFELRLNSASGTCQDIESSSLMLETNAQML
jgi:hypothetical protein